MNVMECPTTSSQQLAQMVGLSHMSTYHTLCCIAHPYKISIQHEVKPAGSPKRAKFYRWLSQYVHSDVSMFNNLKVERV